MSSIDVDESEYNKTKMWTYISFIMSELVVHKD